MLLCGVLYTFYWLTIAINAITGCDKKIVRSRLSYKLHGVNDTAEPDLAVSVTPGSLTQRNQWHRGVRFLGVNDAAESEKKIPLQITEKPLRLTPRHCCGFWSGSASLGQWIQWTVCTVGWYNEIENGRWLVNCSFWLNLRCFLISISIAMMLK